jgi:hypothetical protein
MADGRQQACALCSRGLPTGIRWCEKSLYFTLFYAALPHVKQVVVKMPRQIFCVSLRLIV